MNANKLILTAAAGIAVAVLSLFSNAEAYMISVTGGTSGGNPGGQPLYEVSGLVQGDAFNVTWGGVSGLSVNAMVSIESLTATTADIRVMLENNSPLISGTSPRATVFGVLVDDYTSIANTATGGVDLDLADDSNFPAIAVDVCATSGNNCAGGGGGGVPAAGGTDDFTLYLNGNFAGSLTLSNFALKIQGGPQSSQGDSYELAGVPTPKVPEPTSLVLLLVASAMLYVGRRRSSVMNRHALK